MSNRQAHIESLTVFNPVDALGSTLCLDLGRRTGWCRGRDGVVTDSGVYELYGGKPDVRLRESQRFLALYNFLTDIHKQEPIQVVIFEQIAGGTQGRQTVLANGYRATLVVWCQQNEIPCIPIAVTTIKKEVTGSGKGKKDGIAKAIYDLGHRPFDDNEADSIAAHYAYHKLLANNSICLVGSEPAAPKPKKRKSRAKKATPKADSLDRKSASRKNNGRKHTTSKDKAVPASPVRGAAKENAENAGGSTRKPVRGQKGRAAKPAVRKKRKGGDADARD